MRTDHVSPRLPLPPGAQSKPATKPIGTLHFKIEDIQKHLNQLPKGKQKYALELFPKDSTGRLVKIDENSYKAFMSTLDLKEQRNFTWILPNLKDSRRLIEEPAPGASRPAKGEDLTAPIVFQAKPNPESAKPQPRRPLADLLAAEKAGLDTPVPPKTRTQGQPNRVGFSELAPVRLFPKGENFNPGDFHPGWPQQLIDGPKGKVKGWLGSTTNFRLVEKISLPNSTVSKLGGLGQEAPHPLQNESYPPPPPKVIPKGILKKTEPGKESVAAQEPETKEAGKKKGWLGTAAAVGATLTVAAVAIPTLVSASKNEDSSSSGQGEA